MPHETATRPRGVTAYQEKCFIILGDLSLGLTTALESVITYEGTEPIHQLIVGRELTGVAAF